MGWGLSDIGNAVTGGQYGLLTGDTGSVGGTSGFGDVMGNLGIGKDKNTSGSSTSNFDTTNTTNTNTTNDFSSGGATRNSGNQFINPYLGDYFNRGANLANTGADQSVAGFNPNQNNAFGMIQNRAMGGSDLTRSGNQQMLDTVNGKYLDPNNNPALKASMDAALGNVRSTLGGNFSGNNFGSSAHEELLNKQSMAAMAPILNNERNNQFAATGMAPQYAMNDYNDANQLLGAGGQQQQQQQNVLDDPYKKYQMYGGMINQGIGLGIDTSNIGYGTNNSTNTGTTNSTGTQSGTTTGTVQGNPWADIAGIGSAAAGAYKAFGGGG